MQSSERLTHPGSGVDRTGSDEEATPWVAHGIVSGVLGACVVAVFFLIVDVVEGRPFWTPAALGTALFTGESLEPGASVNPAIVVGYSALHGLVFVAVGFFAAYWLTNLRRELAPVAGLALAGVLFLAFEALFLAYAAVLAEGLMTSFGFGNVALANVFAAGGMAAYLLLRARPEP